MVQFVRTNRYHGAFRAIREIEADQLDALRGISAFGVILGHADQFILSATTTAGNIAGGLIAQGSVMIFFVLSGFLIGKSITRNIEATGGDGFDWLRYAVDRFWRIYPPLLFAISLMLLIWIISQFVLPSGSNQFLHHTSSYGREGINLDWGSVGATLIFRNGFSSNTPDMNGPLWSLSVEVWYYIFVGGLVALIRRPLLLSIFFALFWYMVRGNAEFADFAVVWFAGYGLCIAHNNDRLNSRFLAIGFMVSMIFVLFFALLFAHPEMLSSNHNWIRKYNVALGFAAVFSIGAILKGLVRVPLLIIMPFKKMARYSYTLYLIHVPIFLFLFGVFEPVVVGDYAATFMLAAVGIGIALLIAMSAALIVENKSLLKQGVGLKRQRDF